MISSLLITVFPGISCTYSICPLIFETTLANTLAECPISLITAWISSIEEEYSFVALPKFSNCTCISSCRNETMLLKHSCIFAIFVLVSLQIPCISATIAEELMDFSKVPLLYKIYCKQLTNFLACYIFFNNICLCIH